MAEEMKPGMVSTDTLDLTMRLMNQSSRDLSWTQDRLIEYYERQAVEYAEALVLIGRIFDEANVMDRKTERRMWDALPAIRSAEQYLASRMEEK